MSHDRAQRIRFSEAVPLRRDRRTLHRRLRQTMKVTRAEQTAQVTAALQRLSDRRALVQRATSGAEFGEDLIEFADGTRLRLRVREGNGAMHRLTRHVPDNPVRLERFVVCLGGSWYRLWLASAEGGQAVELLTRVNLSAGSPAPAILCPRGAWWRRPLRER